MKYNVIIADPPWKFDDKLQMSDVKRGAEANYRGTLTVNDIANLDVKSVVDDWAVLALWVPSSMLADGLLTMKNWGFTQKTTFVWGKITKNEKIVIGMGRLFRGSHEIALIGVSGKVYKHLENKAQRTMSVEEFVDYESFDLAVNRRHSEKPPMLHEALEKMFPHAAKLELFARQVRDGWTCLGNEIDGSDIRDSLITVCST